MARVKVGRWARGRKVDREHACAGRWYLHVSLTKSLMLCLGKGKMRKKKKNRRKVEMEGV